MPKSTNAWPALLREFRETMGWTQTQAADAINTTLRSWSRWELGDQIPTGISYGALRCLIEKHSPNLARKIPG